MMTRIYRTAVVLSLCCQAAVAQMPVEPIETIYEDYTPVKMRYWFDLDYASATELPYASGTTAIDISHLREGFHTIHFQVIDNHGATAGVRFSTFFIPERNMDDIYDTYTTKTVRYWTDQDATTTRIVDYTIGVQAIDLDYLTEGTHTLYYQLVTNDGEVSPVRTTTIKRCSLYDIYVSFPTEYDAGTVGSNPLFAQKPDLRLQYDADNIRVRGQLSVDASTTLRLGKLVQAAHWGSNTVDSERFSKAGEENYHPTTLVNSGRVEADSVVVEQSLYRDRWHFLSLPFNTRIADIAGPEDTYWVVRSYDGNARATGALEDTWATLRSSDQMEAGKGYIVQLTNESEAKAAALTFKARDDQQKNAIFTATDVTMPLESHPSQLSHNSDWNLVGNPYPSFYDSRCMDFSSPIIVWNGSGYTAYSLADDDYVLMPFEAFFVQKPAGTNALTFGKEGRQHTVVGDASQRYNAREYADGTLGSVPHCASRNILNFAVATDLQSGATEYKDLQSVINKDRTRVVINDLASMSYEQDKDAPKFMPADPQVPQLMTLESGVQYAINERPMGDGFITFSVYAPEDGEYRFGLVGNASERYNDDNRSDLLADLTILDTETGDVWSLSDGDYVFTAHAGMNAARLVVSLTGEAQAIEQVSVYDDGEMQIGNGRLSLRFARTKRIKVFSLDGRQLYSDTSASASIMLRSGIYIVDINGKTTKIMVK